MADASFTYDVASALWVGKRSVQEDTLLTDFHVGSDHGFAVLADGMGGHSAGDLASRLVVIDAASHLKFLMQDPAKLETRLTDELTTAIETANRLLAERARDDSRVRGMGATFLATVLFGNRLYWASVGDSPLYYIRNGELHQLNEDHSLAPVIAQMVKDGELTQEEADKHPDRNALTSVLMGREVKRIDIPTQAFALEDGDLVLGASDGLQFLSEAEIAKSVKDAGPGATSAQICDQLITALKKLGHPHQDNTALAVIRVHAMPDEVVPADTGPKTEISPVEFPEERYAPELVLTAADRIDDAAKDAPVPTRMMMPPDEAAVTQPAPREAPPASAAAPAAAAENTGAPKWLVPVILAVVLGVGSYVYLTGPKPVDAVEPTGGGYSETSEPVEE